MSNKKVIPTAGISVSEPRNVSIMVVPERGFAEALSGGSKYAISETKIILARGSRQIEELVVTG